MREAGSERDGKVGNAVVGEAKKAQVAQGEKAINATEEVAAETEFL